MNDLTRDLTAVMLAVVGVAVLTTLVSSKNQTASVVQAVSKGFGAILQAAMGGAASAALP